MQPPSSHLNVCRITALLLLSTLVLRPSTLHAQGPLAPPPGPPAPTMKKLDEIEPRTNLQANPAPAGVDTTNAAYHFIINQPGSYYLSANLDVTKGNGIQINAEGVTLDLNGFQIARTSGTGGNGIEIPGTSHRATIRQGSIKGFSHGIESLQLGESYARACSFRDLAVSNCTQKGIHAGDGAVLESGRAYDNSGAQAILASRGSSLSNCTAFNNTTTYGIYASVGCSLSNCSASKNTGTHGIFANSTLSLTNCSAYNNTVTVGIGVGAGSSVTNCSARHNVSAAASSVGIYTDAGCTVTQSTATKNFSAAPSTPSTGIGFWVTYGGTIQNCTASFNEGDGIRIGLRTITRDNTCAFNGLEGDGAGIHATHEDNRIEGNNVTEDDRGIDADASGNLIIKNSASNNTTNYDIAANNKVGGIASAPDSVAISGSTGGAGVGSTNPWSNISF